jgi:V/A-type H+-transporting ATPase subunit A
MTKGVITGVYGNMISAHFDGPVARNEIAHVMLGDIRIPAEVIRINGEIADLQVFDETRGLGCGDAVEFSGELLSVELGPGLLGQIYDGLQNPLEVLAQTHGFFLERGAAAPPLNAESAWDFEPLLKPGAQVRPGEAIGKVQEGLFAHHILLPFEHPGGRLVEIADAGSYTLSDRVATVADRRGQTRKLGLSFRWPVKLPIRCYAERLLPDRPMETGTRIIDTFFPVARGGTYCIPGPFGAGKTVLQQITSRYAKVDVVIIAACGERAGEVVETMREFPKLEDPRTGRSLMERTVIICNTSSMPVAAREASIYTGVTIAEYYRQIGLHVLLLADSTSRWAQALREMSGRLEEIPGEEAFPAYLESRIAAFYERAGLVRLHDGRRASVTIGGTVSPAGGNFEEPVTQGTLKVVGAFHGLSRERADARRFPAIDPLISWSKYPGNLDATAVAAARELLREGNEIHQMMMVVGEEGITMSDYLAYLKAEWLDAVYVQQDSFHPVDSVCSAERQAYVFALIREVLAARPHFEEREAARSAFAALRQLFIDWNGTAWESAEFANQEAGIREQLATLGRA